MNRSTMLASLILVASAGLLVAGPLSPPVGPVASSYKTLSEVEPRIAVNAANTPGDISSTYRITQPGSYYLTGNIQIVGKNGVQITSPGVTLDLSGFEIVDTAPFAGPTRYGVHVLPGLRNVCVRNGSLRNINGAGLYDQGGGGRFEGLSFNGCHGEGLHSDTAATIVGCTAYSCDAEGFHVSSGTIDGCTSRSNGGPGFWLGSDTIATRCAAHSNTGAGFETAGGVMTQCAANQNSYGFYVSGAQVSDCEASANNSGQVRAVQGCLIRACNLEGVAGFPVILLSGSQNRVEGNRTNSGTYGVQTSAGAGFNVIVGNSIFTPMSAPGILTAATDSVGPLYTTAGTISSTNPFTNFIR